MYTWSSHWPWGQFSRLWVHFHQLKDEGMCGSKGQRLFTFPCLFHFDFPLGQRMLELTRWGGKNLNKEAYRFLDVVLFYSSYSPLPLPPQLPRCVWLATCVLSPCLPSMSLVQPQSNELTREPLSWFITFVYMGSTHRRKSAAWHKF